MNTGRTSLIAISAIIGGALTGFAANSQAARANGNSTPPPGGTNYTVSVVFTSAPPVIADVTGLPRLEGVRLRAGTNGLTMTDGSGQINGVESVFATNLTNFCPFHQATYIVDVSGTIRSVKSNAVVTMSLKGAGYAQDALGATQAASSLNLRFTSQGGIVALTNSVPAPTNDIIVLTTNRGGVVTSNYYHLYYSTNNYYYPGYTVLAFLTEDSRIYTNGSSIVASNSIVNDVYPFGATLSTNGEFTFTPDNSTNQFTNVVISYDVTYVADGINPPESFTNDVYGLDVSQVPAFEAAYLAANSFTNTSLPNFREVSLVASVSTNTTFGFTNIFVTNNLPVMSNHWYQMSGVINGRLGAVALSDLPALRAERRPNGPVAKLGDAPPRVVLPVYYVLRDEPARLSGRHTLFSELFVGSGANTGIGLQFSLSVRTNDLGVIYLGRQCCDDCDFGVCRPISFTAGVVQYYDHLYFTADNFFNTVIPSRVSGRFPAYDLEAIVSGAGTINFRNDTYRTTLTGLGWSRGLNLGLHGVVGQLDEGINVFPTNLAGLDNLSAANLGINYPLYTMYSGGTLQSLSPTPAFTSSTYNVSGFALTLNNSFYSSYPSVGYYGWALTSWVQTNNVQDGVSNATMSGTYKGQAVPPVFGINSLNYKF